MPASCLAPKPPKKKSGRESPPTHKHFQCSALGTERFSTALDQLRDRLKKEIECFPDLRWEGHHQLSGASQLTTGHQVASGFQVDGFLGALANDF